MREVSFLFPETAVGPSLQSTHLSTVRLGLTPPADLGREETKLLAIRSGENNLGRLGDGDLDSLRDVDKNRVRVSELDIEALRRDRREDVRGGSRLGRSGDTRNAGLEVAENLGNGLNGGTETNTNKPELNRVSLGNSRDGVVDEGASQTPHRALPLLPGIVDGQRQRALVGGLEDDGRVDGNSKGSKRALNLNKTLGLRRGAGGRRRNRKRREGKRDLVGDGDGR